TAAIWKPKAGWPFLVLVIGAFGLWIWSLGYTVGGIDYASRMLVPAAATGGAAGVGIILAGLSSRQRRRGLLLISALGVIALYPLGFYPQPTRWDRPATWPSALLATDIRLNTRLAGDSLGDKRYIGLAAAPPKAIPPDSRIVTFDTYALATLRQTDPQWIPAWSPAVAPAFEPGLDPETTHQRLRQHEVDALLLNNPKRDPNARWLREKTAIFELAKAWPVIARDRNSAWVLVAVPPSLRSTQPSTTRPASP
ncbi:MAG: hypothetical protein R3336_05305, partial [Phycisphaeraceae bacterium]|nr:hypothetical protein [Phycisphaeraceae bacterium]